MVNIPMSTDGWSLGLVNVLVLRKAMQGEAGGMPSLATPYGQGEVLTRRDDDNVLVLKLPYGKAYLQPGSITSDMPCWTVHDPVQVPAGPAFVVRTLDMMGTPMVQIQHIDEKSPSEIPQLSIVHPKDISLRLALTAAEYLRGVLAAKARGNKEFQGGDLEAAASSYMSGVTLCQHMPNLDSLTPGQRALSDNTLVALLSNMSAVALKMEDFDAALRAANTALGAVQQGAQAKGPLVQKTILRRAQALLGTQDWEGAVDTLKHPAVAQLASGRKLMREAQAGAAAANKAGRKVWAKAFQSAADENAVQNVVRTAVAGGSLDGDAAEPAQGPVVEDSVPEHTIGTMGGPASEPAPASAMSIFEEAKREAGATSSASAPAPAQASLSPEHSDAEDGADSFQAQAPAEQRSWFKKKRVWLGTAAAVAAAAAIVVARAKK